MIHVSQRDTEPYTSVDEEDVVLISRAENDTMTIQESTIQIVDKLAPVIIRAVYVNNEDDLDNKPDSLILTFSENIGIPLDRFPFVFIQEDGEEYTMDLVFAHSRDGNQLVYTVEQIHGKEFPDATDSVFINPLADVGDVNGNIQNTENRKTVLTIKDPGQKFQMITAQNPFDFTDQLIPGSIRSTYGISETEGMVIIVEPLSRASIVSGFKAQFTIYDLLGNVVIASAGKIGANNIIYFNWDGKNKNGRDVGTGTYMLTVKITDVFDQVTFQKIMLGITKN